jgi:hypothetical protein
MGSGFLLRDMANCSTKNVLNHLKTVKSVTKQKKMVVNGTKSDQRSQCDQHSSDGDVMLYLVLN